MALEDDDSNLMSLDKDRSVAGDNVAKSAQEVKSNFRKRNMHVITQSCDYDSNLFSEFKKKDGLLNK